MALVAGLLPALCAPSARTAAAADVTAEGVPRCPPTAIVDGPPEIVARVVAILRSHGVGTPSPSCGVQTAVKASLVAEPDAKGYRLHVLDAVGHSSVRQVTDAATAASLIESWALDEDAELLAPRPVPGTTRGGGDGGTPPAAVPERGRDPAEEQLHTGTAPAAAHIGVAAEASISPGDAVWWGAGANFCARVGALCLGARASFARAETTLEINPALGIAPDLTRTIGGLSALASWRASAGRFWVAPSLGLGASWLRSHASQAGVTSTTGDLLARVEAGAVTGVEIGKGWSVGLGLSGTLAMVLRGDARQGTVTYVPAAPRGLFTASVGMWYAP